MGHRKTFQMWVDRVVYDMGTAKAMLQTGRWIYAIFMCQQSLEKCFKALLAYRQKQIVPIHNLRRLAETASVVNELNDSKLMKLDFLSNYYINARYAVPRASPCLHIRSAFPHEGVVPPSLRRNPPKHPPTHKAPACSNRSLLLLTYVGGLTKNAAAN
jgi:HEPN domain-containing protein